MWYGGVAESGTRLSDWAQVLYVQVVHLACGMVGVRSGTEAGDYRPRVNAMWVGLASAVCCGAACFLLPFCNENVLLYQCRKLFPLGRKLSGEYSVAEH